MDKMKKKDNSVFFISLAVVFIVVLLGILAPTGFEKYANKALSFVVEDFGWFFMLTMSTLVVFAIWLATSKYGQIKLGPDDSKPDYNLVSWFAMLFSAGMGIGLVFWGVAEPLNHFVAPLGLEPGSTEAVNFALRKSFFHWGLHPWANYSVLALALAYMQFRKGKPGLISSIFIPLIGEKRTSGPIGKVIDIIAIFATVAGVATSLGLGAMQINSGLNYLFGLPETKLTITVIVTIITILFILTAVTGLDKGIKDLANLNVAICVLLLIACIVVGPTVIIANSFTNGVGQYFSSLVPDSFAINPFGDNSWYGSWTIFYWAWWIAWAPFVGTFIARISRGRTIREFVLGVMLAPTVASFIWFSVFGTLGMNLGVETATEAAASTSTAFFVVMSNYPLGTIISVIAVALLSTFFITSANSATFVLGMMSSEGDLNPTNTKKLLWGVMQSALALILMFSSANGLQMLQTASILTAFPFAFIMIFAMVSITKALMSDPLILAQAASEEAVKKSA
jgi:glycine betaine transporter